MLNLNFSYVPDGALGRRSRRGFSLFETILTLFLVVIAINEGYRLIEAETSRIQNRLEVDRVVELADLGERFVRRDMVAIVADLRSRPGFRRELTVGELEETGLVMADAITSQTPLRREVELWLHAPSGSEVVVLARAHGDVARVNIPGSVASTGPIGWVSPVAPTHVRGIGLDWDVSDLQRSWGWPAENDLVAVRYMDFNADIRPYLHRSNVTMNGIDLNEMATDLDMGGNSIANVGNLDAEVVVAESLLAPEIVVSDRLYANSLSVSGHLRVDGPFEAETGDFRDSVTTDRATITSLNARSVDVDRQLTATYTSISGTLSAGAITANSINAESAQINGSFFAHAFSVNSLTANEMAVRESVRANSGLIESMITGSCSGC